MTATDRPTALGAPVGEAVLRAEPADFRVDEQMSVEPTGAGEHLWVEIEKTGWNTGDVAAWLARAAGLPRRSVSFSGLKDRHAVTRQWFSLHLPGRPDPDLTEPPEGLRVLAARRHERKLNRGTHRANAFVLRLRQWCGDDAALAARVAVIRARGVPNYFGDQRFGRDGANLERARAWLTGSGEAPRTRSVRGLWLSAARSALFNRVLAERVHQDCWDRVLDGDVLQPAGSRGLFAAAEEPRAAARVAAGEVHPCAPLPGIAGMAPSGACAELEARVLAGDDTMIRGLAREGVAAARRATRLPVSDLALNRDQTDLYLSFSLPTGAYATTVLAELIRVYEFHKGGKRQ